MKIIYTVILALLVIFIITFSLEIPYRSGSATTTTSNGGSLLTC